MKLLQLTILLVMSSVPLVSCNAPAASANSLSAQAMPTPTPMLVPGNWEISFANFKYFPSRIGWRHIRIEILVRNKTDAYGFANISTQNAKLFTRDMYSYDLSTLQTTGASKPITTTSITFKSTLPKGYRMKGEYNDQDAVVSYCFQAEIPNIAEPDYVFIPSYLGGHIPIGTKSNDFLLPDQSVDFHLPGTNTQFGTRATLTIGSFQRAPAWPTTNDLISATLIISSPISTIDMPIQFFYLPITGDGIVGARYTNTSDCQPKLMIPPGMSLTSQICALVPHGAAPIHMIFWGDGRAVYDTQLK